MGKKPPLPPWLEHAALVKKKMKDRGFKMADRVQICEKCDEYAEETWSLKGPQGMGGALADAGVAALQLDGSEPLRQRRRYLQLPRLVQLLQPGQRSIDDRLV